MALKFRYCKNRGRHGTLTEGRTGGLCNSSRAEKLTHHTLHEALHVSREMGKGKTRKRKNGNEKRVKGGKAEKRVKGGKAEKRVKGGKAEKRVKGGKAEKRVKGGKKGKRRKSGKKRKKE